MRFSIHRLVGALSAVCLLACPHGTRAFCEATDRAGYDCRRFIGPFEVFWRRPTPDEASSPDPYVDMGFVGPADRSYVAVGWSETGDMVGGFALVGWAGDGGDLGIYRLSSRNADGSGVQRTDEVGLRNKEITVSGGNVEFRFALQVRGTQNQQKGIPLLSPEPGVNNRMIWSRGSAKNNPGQLSEGEVKGFGTLDFDTQASSTTTIPSATTTLPRTPAPTQAASPPAQPRTAAPTQAPPDEEDAPAGGGAEARAVAGSAGASTLAAALALAPAVVALFA